MSVRCTPLYIGSQKVYGKDKQMIMNPYSNEVAAELCIASADDVDAAISAAANAAPIAAALTANERALILEDSAQELRERTEEFALAITTETGKPLRDTRAEAKRGAETLILSATAARTLSGEMVPMDSVENGRGCLAFTMRVPIGVIAAITPFNAPLNLVLHKLGPAIAAGNSVVLKPSEQGSLVATMLTELLVSCGYPAGALNVVHGGAKVGSRLVADERVRLISFTGGVPAAKSITAIAGVKRVQLELGGNSATIVHHDTNIQETAQICVRSAFSNSGQTCISVQRVYVHESKFDSFLDAFVSGTRKLVVGDPLDENSDIGSMVSEQSAKRVESWVTEAVQGGAEVVCGGAREGATMWPTVLVNTSPDMKVVCEEVFGPVAVLMPYSSLDEVILEVNDSRYGLQAGLFTDSLQGALDAWRGLDVGGLIVNGPSTFRTDSMPYGGVKDSGIGREGPLYAVNEMTEQRLVVFK